tara:strand:- start:46 stop:528 length:483 start_codon:yes stop_codon:yes gene_type:complete
MAIEWDTEGFYRTINFFKKRETWQEILAVAASNVEDTIASDAKNILYSQVNKVTGSVGNSIETTVDISDDDVTLSVGSNHPAANMIEYGGLVPAEPFDPKSALPNIDDYADDVFAYSNYIKKKQPFKQERPFIRPALLNATGKINGEIIRVANKFKKEYE